MMPENVEPKKNTKMIWQGVSLLGMLLAPALLLYSGARSNSSGLIVFGYLILVSCMLIPLFLKK